MHTPEHITKLKDREIIVVGTNRMGSHLGGLARQAVDNFGLEWGVDEGLSGKCYAFPTLDLRMKKVSHLEFRQSAVRFLATTKALPEYTFYLTKIGTGIAGFSEDYVKEFFKECPDNVVKPEGWDA